MVIFSTTKLFKIGYMLYLRAVRVASSSVPRSSIRLETHLTLTRRHFRLFLLARLSSRFYGNARVAYGHLGASFGLQPSPRLWYDTRAPFIQNHFLRTRLPLISSWLLAFTNDYNLLSRVPWLGGFKVMLRLARRLSKSCHTCPTEATCSP